MSITANLASVASAGQALVNLLITPFLLQHLGVWAALLVTPAAYVGGEALVMAAQTVHTQSRSHRALDTMALLTRSSGVTSLSQRAVLRTTREVFT